MKLKPPVIVSSPIKWDWKKTTCRQASRMHDVMIVWRPDGKLSKTPDQDLALYVEA